MRFNPTPDAHAQASQRSQPMKLELSQHIHQLGAYYRTVLEACSIHSPEACRPNILLSTVAYRLHAEAISCARLQPAISPWTKDLQKIVLRNAIGQACYRTESWTSACKVIHVSQPRMLLGASSSAEMADSFFWWHMSQVSCRRQVMV